LHRTRCQIDGCSTLSEPIAQAPSRVNYYTQQTALKEKNLENKNIYSEVQQINLQRLDKTWWRWLTPDQTGKRAGRPRFTKKGELRSFGFALLQSPKSCLFFISF
jgi:putative transposase